MMNQNRSINAVKAQRKNIFLIVIVGHQSQQLLNGIDILKEIYQSTDKKLQYNNRLTNEVFLLSQLTHFFLTPDALHPFGE